MQNSLTLRDNDILYRRVKHHKEDTQQISDAKHRNQLRYIKNKSGRFIVQEMAFYDKNNKISVSTASRHNNISKIISEIQVNVDNGVIKLIVDSVYNIEVRLHHIFIDYTPTVDNPEHYEITIIPEEENIPVSNLKVIRGEFREELAMIANLTGWEREPSS